MGHDRARQEAPWSVAAMCVSCFVSVGERAKGRAGVLACALQGSTDVELSPMFSIGFT